MKLHWIGTAAVILLAGPALAAGWTAEMVEDEGGPVMMASVDGEGGDVPPLLELMCGAPGEVSLRYGFGSGPGEEVQLPTGAYDFSFRVGDTATVLHLQYEDMDGMYAGYFPATDPVVFMLGSGATVSISDPTGAWHEQVFPLAGSKKAIAKLLAACK